MGVELSFFPPEKCFKKRTYKEPISKDFFFWKSVLTKRTTKNLSKLFKELTCEDILRNCFLCPESVQHVKGSSARVTQRIVRQKRPFTGVANMIMTVNSAIM